MKTLSTILFTCFAAFSYSQSVVSNACSSALSICDGDVFPINTGASPNPVLTDTNSVSNPGTNPNPGNPGCLAVGEENPNWFVFDIQTDGILAFHFATASGSGFLDWSMWPSNANSCQMIQQDSLPPVACNRNGSSTGLTGMADASNIPAGGSPTNFEAPINVSAGDQFIICMNNYSAQVGTLTFTNIGTAGICQSTSGITEESATYEKELVKIVDVTGREVNDQPNTVMIYLYQDGSSERIFRAE